MSVDIDTEDQEVRTQRPLRRSGNSTVVTIPTEILQAAGFAQGDAVEVVTGFRSGEIKLRTVREEDPE